MKNAYLYIVYTKDIDIDSVTQYLAPARRERISGMKHPGARLQSAAAGYALHLAMRDFFPDYFPPPDMRYAENGRPCVDGAHISLSHTTGAAICAISAAEIGVDIELSARKLTEGVKKRVFGAYARGDDMEMWTAMEARYKLNGDVCTAGASPRPTRVCGADGRGGMEMWTATDARGGNACAAGASPRPARVYGADGRDDMEMWTAAEARGGDACAAGASPRPSRVCGADERCDMEIWTETVARRKPGAAGAGIGADRVAASAFVKHFRVGEYVIALACREDINVIII